MRKVDSMEQGRRLVASPGMTMTSVDNSSFWALAFVEDMWRRHKGESVEHEWKVVVWWPGGPKAPFQVQDRAYISSPQLWDVL